QRYISTGNPQFLSDRPVLPLGRYPPRRHRDEECIAGKLQRKHDISLFSFERESRSYFSTLGFRILLAFSRRRRGGRYGPDAAGDHERQLARYPFGKLVIPPLSRR